MRIILVGGRGIPGDGEAHDEERHGVRNTGGRVIRQRKQQDGTERKRRCRAYLRQRNPSSVREPPRDRVPYQAPEESAKSGGEQVQPRDDARLPVRESHEIQPDDGEVERRPGYRSGDPLRDDDLERGQPNDAPSVPEQLLRLLHRRRRCLDLARG